MKYLNPKTIDVMSVELISRGYDGEEKITRRVPLGLFILGVTDESFVKAIEKYGLAPRLLGAASLADGRSWIQKRPQTISAGVVFETADECCAHLKCGVTWEDINEGLTLVPGETHEDLEV
jgi:isocitrate dehydrogenase kinase/phosphatase